MWIAYATVYIYIESYFHPCWSDEDFDLNLSLKTCIKMKYVCGITVYADSL